MRSDPITVVAAFCFGFMFLLALNATGFIQLTTNQQPVTIDVADVVQKLVNDNIQMKETIQTQNETITSLQNTTLYERNNELQTQVDNMNGARYIFGLIMVLFVIATSFILYHVIDK